MWRIMGALCCAVQGFPPAYLGLLLLWEKLSLADFLPMIAKVDKYLVGWRTRPLSPAGRLVLINAVLDALPTYAMAGVMLSPAVIKAPDALRHAFLWNAAERAIGTQCLVAWERVCRSKDEGGLGVRDLATQNESLCFSRCSTASIRRLRPHTRPRGFGQSWMAALS